MEWDRLLNLLKKATEDLNRFRLETAGPSLVLLTTLLADENMQETDNLWQICKQSKLVMNQDDMYKRKILAVETIISKMETEILNTLATIGAHRGTHRYT